MTWNDSFLEQIELSARLYAILAKIIKLRVNILRSTRNFPRKNKNAYYVRVYVWGLATGTVVLRSSHRLLWNFPDGSNCWNEREWPPTSVYVFGDTCFTIRCFLNTTSNNDAWPMPRAVRTSEPSIVKYMFENIHPPNERTLAGLLLFNLPSDNVNANNQKTWRSNRESRPRRS